MKKTFFIFPFLAISCGHNPFDHGAEGGLAFYAAIGLETAKPPIITMDLEPLSPSNGNASVSLQLAKKASPGSGRTQSDFYVNPDGSIRLENQVWDWPSGKDMLWRLTGRYEWNFEYAGPPPSLQTFDTSLIVRYVSLSFFGRALKTSDPVMDSLEFTLVFPPGAPEDWAAGRMVYRVINGSVSEADGRGDSISYALDFADIKTGEQAGVCHTYDHGASSFFSMEIFITHQNFSDPSKPFRSPGDNAGRITFSQPYQGTGDSLYYDIRFFPPRDGQLESRTGTVRRNAPGGPLVIQFRKDASGSGWIDYYGEDGSVFERKEF